MQTIFGIILGGPPPYDSQIDFYSPLLVIVSPLVIAYSILAVLGRRSPTLLDAITTAVCVWVLAGICDTKFQTEVYSYPWTRFGCRDIVGCAGAGLFTVLVTWAAISYCEKKGYRYASQKGMLLGFLVGYFPMAMMVAPAC